MIPTEYSFVRYLSAKKTVDDRALNRPVWEALARAITQCRSTGDSFRVLEIGAGIGTMIERTVDWGLLPDQTIYTAVDSSPQNITEAHRRLPGWAAAQGFETRQSAEGDLIIRRGQQQVSIRLETADVFDYMAREQARGSCDLLIAHAFLDLIDIPAALRRLLALLAAGGLYYFTINFDGVTALEPALDPALDAQIEALYHRTMDERMTDGLPSGDSRSGRHLFQHLRAAGASILSAGSSDWVVFPAPDGYPADEAYFLHFIIHTIHTALLETGQIEAQRLAEWADARHRQIVDGELVYIAHQIDIAGYAADQPG